MQNIIVQLTLELWLKFNAYHHHSVAIIGGGAPWQQLSWHIFYHRVSIKGDPPYSLPSSPAKAIGHPSKHHTANNKKKIITHQPWLLISKLFFYFSSFSSFPYQVRKFLMLITGLDIFSKYSSSFISNNFSRSMYRQSWRLQGYDQPLSLTLQGSLPYKLCKFYNVKIWIYTLHMPLNWICARKVILCRHHFF